MSSTEVLERDAPDFDLNDDEVDFAASSDSHAPPAGARTEAKRGLAWRDEYNRGGTAVGIARARDIANGKNLPMETIRRMNSFFARHEVDKQGQGWSPDQDGYPSNGRIAWALWGGDAGWAWAKKIIRSAESANATAFIDTTEFGAPDLTGIQFEATQRGTWVTRNMKIFKSGSFQDSAGNDNTFSDADLHDMVRNFNLLRDRGLFPNVPVRANHGRDVENVVGYVVGLQVMGTFLVADLEITEPDAKTKLQRGTWRARSAEIGTYQTNEGEAFSPVLWGLAFVDIPAVEGLYNKASTSNTITIEETDVENDKGAVKPEVAEFSAEAETADFAAEFAKAQEHIAVLEGRTFTIAGHETADFAAVQAHIDALEEFAAEARSAARDSFIEGLADAGKIAAPQVESLKAFASTLSPEQFEGFKAGYADAPVLSLLAKHSGEETEPSADATGDADRAAEIEKCEEVVALHRRAGTPEDTIKSLPSFIRLAELQAQA